MKIQNIFFVICASMILVPGTYSMVVTTKRVSNAFFNVQKRYNSRPFDISVGRKYISMEVDEQYTSRDLPEIYNNIKKLGAINCANKSFFTSSYSMGRDIFFCDSDTCCGKASFFAMQKNVRAQEELSAIKKKFLKTIAKKGEVTSLREIEEMYESLIKFRVVLNEFCGDTYWGKRLELYEMIKNINLCLFNQAQVILEDTFEQSMQNDFKMTSTLKEICDIGDSINEWHKNEQEYSDAIADERFKHLYKIALVRNPLKKMNQDDQTVVLFDKEKNQENKKNLEDKEFFEKIKTITAMNINGQQYDNQQQRSQQPHQQQYNKRNKVDDGDRRDNSAHDLAIMMGTYMATNNINGFF